MALDVDAVAVRQRRSWRHTVRGADPLAGRVPPPDGRWQRGATVEALYLASDEATVWAEWYRHLAEAGIPPDQQMPRDLWKWVVERGLDVADLTTVEHLKGASLTITCHGRQTWPPHQKVGEQLWREGWPGLLAPVPRDLRTASCSASSATPRTSDMSDLCLRLGSSVTRRPHPGA